MSSDPRDERTHLTQESQKAEEVKDETQALVDAGRTDRRLPGSERRTGKERRVA